MPDPLLSAALAEAERAEPEDKGVALLHIARVLRAEDRPSATHLFAEALEILASLGLHNGGALDDEVVRLAAAVDPERMRQLLDSNPNSRFRRRHNGQILVQIMLQHGHSEAATRLLSDPAAMRPYPFRAVSAVIANAVDESARLKVLRAAIVAWKQIQNDHDAQMSEAQFYAVFAQHWKLLPHDEAAQLTKEIVKHILEAPDFPTNASIMLEADGVEFTSSREFDLWTILSPLRQLAPETLGTVLKTHQQFAKGAARFPLGHESTLSEPRPPRPSGSRPGFIVGGCSPEEVDKNLAMLHAEQTGDFEPRFREALRLYAEDSDPAQPNYAPRECWPSTQTFRDALYLAGKKHGRQAVAYLDRIPDPGLKMLAQIELAAALSGLPQFSGTRSTLFQRHSRGALAP